MIKKIVYIGLIMLALSIIIYYAIFSSSLSSISSTAGYSRAYNNFTLNSNSINVFNFSSENSTASFYLESSNKPINAFLANSTGYKAWKALNLNSSDASSLTAVKSLEGKGVLIAYENVTNATVPAYSGAFYVYNNTNMTLGLLGSGTFYFITTLYDSNEVHASVNGTFIKNVTITGLISKAKDLSYDSLAVTVLFILSLIIILVGILKQDKSKQKEEIKPEVIDELYKNVKTQRQSEHAGKQQGNSGKGPKKGTQQ